MKFYCLTVFISILMLSQSVLLGQQLDRIWAVEFESLGKSDIIHRLYQSMNGILVAVGETFNEKNEHDALLLFFEPETGKLIQRIVYGSQNKKDDRFHDIVQYNDGSFYLVGASSTKSVIESLMLHVDENGQLLENIPVGVGILHRIILMDNNALIIFGQGQRDDGEITVIKYGNKKISKHRIGSNRYLDVAGVAKTSNNYILLCGNTAKSGTSQRGDIWIAKLDENGNFLEDRIIGDKTWERVWDATATMEGNLIMSTEKGGNYQDACIIEIDSKLNIVINESLIGERDEYASATIKTHEGYYIVVQQVVKPVLSKAILLRGFKTFAETELSSSNFIYEVRHIYYGYRGKLLIGGTVREDKSLKIRVECLGNQMTFVNNSKAVTKPEIKIIDEPRLEDENGDGELSPNERAWIAFRIKNTGNVPLVDAKVKLIPSNLNGVNYFDEVYVRSLPVNGEEKISIPFNGMDILKQKTFSASLEFYEGKELLAQLPIRIGKINDAFKIIVDWKDDKLRGNNREIRATNPIFEAEINAYSDRPIVESNTKTYLNGRVVVDHKAVKNLETIKTQNRFNTIIHINLPLVKGKNEVYIEIEQDGIIETTTPIIIYFEPRKPNLHVLAIGPPYTDLQYTSKDAMDFANMLQGQKNSAIYNEVFIQQLIRAEETTCQNIKSTFERLPMLYNDVENLNKIVEKDVLVVFISSHGKLLDNQFVIVPSDYSPDAEKSTTVNYKQDIIAFLDKIKCKKLMFIDACHSGAAARKSFSNPNTSTLLNALNAASAGMISISSCNNRELSFEDTAWENGAFTEALLEALSNKEITLSDGTTLFCDSKIDGEINALSVREIFKYLQLRVPDLVQQKLGVPSLQTPTMPQVEGIDTELNIFLLPSKSND